MGLLSEDILKDITTHYLFANTPSYLFSHLRSLPQLQHHAQEVGTQEIIERADLLLSSIETPEQLMEIYGLIVLLSFKLDIPAGEALRRYSSLSQDWVQVIANLSQEIRVPMSSLFIPIDKISFKIDTGATSSGSAFTQILVDEQSDKN